MAKYLTSAGLSRTVGKLLAIISANKTEAADNLATAVTTLSEDIDKKVSIVDGKDLISVTEAAKLAKINVTDEGVINVANIPATALPVCVTVDSIDAMYALTTDQVQNGDTVRVVTETLDTDGVTVLNTEVVMYYVVDDTKLNEAAGYHVYSAVADWCSLTHIPEKVVNPTALKIQINGEDLVAYTGTETDEVVANITVDKMSIEEITDEEIDAMFPSDTTGEDVTSGEDSGEGTDTGEDPVDNGDDTLDEGEGEGEEPTA